ncbi:MAG TPA: hypothetical protein VD997_00315 [Phycisphaerales bacterium]|nr:hypothetical protein [Phycisphaerales bacterium]
MRKLVQVGKVAVVAGLLAAVGVGVSTASAARPPRPPVNPCLCIDVYMPVLCPNGVVYSNSCYAGCAGQTNCVPLYDPPVEEL